MPFKLLAFDTDRIKDFVFATDTLKEIRGASALLDQLNRVRMQSIVTQIDAEARTIYAQGGGALFLVAADKADAAQLAVEQSYRKYSGQAASITGVSLDVRSDFDELSPSKSLLKLLQFRLRQAKDQMPTALSLTALPYLRHCDACGEFPAAERLSEFDEQKLLCRACRSRRLVKRGVWERLQDYGVSPGRLPQDFNEIGEASNPSGYIGLLYADGNGMGREIEACATLSEVRQFADAVDGALHQAVCEVIRDHLAPERGVFPCVPLLLGGDDLVMVTRAQSAIDAATTLTEKFGDYTQQLLNKRLSLSIGVVLAHAKFPFRTMLDLAESALKFAKREAVKRQLTGDRSLVNFMIISNANHLDFKSFYSEMLKYQPNPQQPAWLRTQRPYTPADLRELLKTARALKDAPRGRLQALGECVFLPPEQAKLEGATALMRWQGKSESGRNVEQVKAVKALLPQTSEFPWDVTDRSTPLFDLVELFNFVKDGKNARTN
jgi:hypothetical protein